MPDSLEQLVARAVQRDRDAFAELICRHERTALGVAYAILGDASTAGDAVQDAFLRAWQRLAELKDPARFAPWLCGIVRHLAIDRRRRDRPLEQLSLAADAATERTPLADAGDQEQRQRIRQALASLDETTRTVLVLRYYEDLPSKRIADLLGLSPAAIDMRLSRGRAELRRILGAQTELV